MATKKRRPRKLDAPKNIKPVRKAKSSSKTVPEALLKRLTQAATAEG